MVFSKLDKPIDVLSNLENTNYEDYETMFSLLVEHHYLTDVNGFCKNLKYNDYGMIYTLKKDYWNKFFKYLVYYYAHGPARKIQQWFRYVKYQNTFLEKR